MTVSHVTTPVSKLVDKDVVLAEKAECGINIAQFASFFPEGNDKTIRFIRTRTCSMDYPKMPIEEVVDILMQTAIDKTLNIRTFTPTTHQGNPFIYGIESADEVVAKIKELRAAGYHVIVHETIDVNDGGVSGVLSHQYVECAPGYTPRLVENCPEGAAILSTTTFDHMLTAIYGKQLSVEWYQFIDTIGHNNRVEFSIHPRRVGLYAKHYLAWEISHEEWSDDTAHMLHIKADRWPNALSRLIGDKAYGLLMVDLQLHFLPLSSNACDRVNIPKTVVFCKHPAIGLFQFGNNTGSGKVWTRTCPREQIPGKHPSFDTWVDPFGLFKIDTAGENELASCIVQDGVAAVYSGAAFINTRNELVCEFTSGKGDAFMQGTAIAQHCITLPPEILSSTPDGIESAAPMTTLLSFLPQIWKIINRILEKKFGDITKFRMEWAFDGHTFWILQFHVGDTGSCDNVIVPGEPDEWVDFSCEHGLEALRSLISEIKDTNHGIHIIGNVGMTSHIADVCRKAKIPSIIKPK